ncbi:MAG TPA: ligase-associated DNA damage response exonuclease [Planctomycetaceae bacterium]|nr:ligase-associated DNA damage response exonuclease [Planctomycetaceae bacterium]
MTTPLLQETPAGLYCEQGDFYVDPCRRVDRAVITHAHADHARPGSRKYLAAKEGRRVLRSRLGSSAEIEAMPYGETKSINGVTLSFHPAGHILGSAQVRLEYRGEVWVVSGDYKIELDATCAEFEHVRCHTFITESTFGQPVYVWPTQQSVFSEINHWWMQCRDEHRPAVILAYALGKAQRIIAGVDSSIGPIYCHPSVQLMNDEYRASGIDLPKTWLPSQAPGRKGWGGVLIVAPPSMAHSAWLSQFGNASVAMASGWILTGGTRRQKSVDVGFPLSDHADWPGLLKAIDETRADQILVTHGDAATLVGWLNAHGKQAREIMMPQSRTVVRTVP